jgi:hypothetical protein
MSSYITDWTVSLQMLELGVSVFWPFRFWCFSCGNTVVQDGFIVEEGTHDQLFSHDNSAYHSLVKLQELATEKRIEGGLEAAPPDEIPAGGQLSAQQFSSKKLLENTNYSKKGIDNEDKDDELVCPCRQCGEAEPTCDPVSGQLFTSGFDLGQGCASVLVTRANPHCSSWIMRCSSA